jgi:hypothetical protein
MNLQQMVNDAITELHEWRVEHPDVDEPHDAIFEIADSSIPVYTHQLLLLAADNCHLATDEPELGPANGSNFDGTPSPINIIASNVFEYIERALWMLGQRCRMRRSTMTLHEVTAWASQRLTHEWELYGPAINPAPAIRRIVDTMASVKPQVRDAVEAHLHDEWSRLCELEGDD